MLPPDRMLLVVLATAAKKKKMPPTDFVCFTRADADGVAIYFQLCVI